MIQLENCISFTTGKAYQQINKRARELLKPHGVTPIQYALLSLLWEKDSMSGSELSDRLILDSAAMTGLVDRAESLGLVVRKSDKDDRRISRISLTTHGRDLKRPLTKAIRILNEEVEDLLGNETSGFMRSLKKIAARN